MDNNNFSPYVNKPERSGSNQALRDNKGAKMAAASKIIGIVALISTITFTVYPGMVLGAFAAVMAYLSKGGGTDYSRDGRKGIRTGVTAVILNIGLAIFVIWVLFTNNGVRDRVNEIMQSMYNMSLDDFIWGNPNLNNYM